MASRITRPPLEGFMTNSLPHIAVCMGTYKRPEFLRRLLGELRTQETDGLFTYSVVVADNDPLGSAEAVVSEVSASSPIPVRYCVETRRNIPIVRNTAIANAKGDFIAFIDDDEFPPARWLLTLFEAWKKYGVAGVLGPVTPYFDDATPGWVVKGKFYERQTYPTGSIIHWTMGRSGNMLFERRVLDGVDEPFRPAYHRGGADQDFFRRLIERGYSFVWCNEAAVHEFVPPVRWKRSYMLRKAMLSGSFAPLHPKGASREIARSLVAVPVHTAFLPFGLAVGHHIFMSHLEKLCYHLGRLFGYAGVRLVKAPHLPQ